MDAAVIQHELVDCFHNSQQGGGGGGVIQVDVPALRSIQYRHMDIKSIEEVREIVRVVCQHCKSRIAGFSEVKMMLIIKNQVKWAKMVRNACILAESIIQCV